jgi:hypothetical protein
MDATTAFKLFAAELDLVEGEVTSIPARMIVALGKDAIPLILLELELELGYWIPLLERITGLRHGENPFEARDRWLEWGTKVGYLA